MSAISRKLRSVEGGRVMFWCPGCDGAHAVTVEDAPNRQGPIWGYNGDPERPTFTPSIFVNAPGRHHNPQAPSCHSFVRDGRIQFLGDCTHALAGQTVDMPDFDGGDL
ncbi:MAG: DUF6527 family protein [Rhizobiaceae bacterium]|nr:DUF6527 family protein [Rhizobiaceae bacterium]